MSDRERLVTVHDVVMSTSMSHLQAAQALAAFDAEVAAAEARGRQQVAEELEAYAENYPADVFTPDGTSKDAIAGTAMRHAYLNAARIAREGNPS